MDSCRRCTADTPTLFRELVSDHGNGLVPQTSDELAAGEGIRLTGRTGPRASLKGPQQYGVLRIDITLSDFAHVVIIVAVLRGLGLSPTSAWRQKEAQLTRASSDGSCVTSKLLRNDRRTPLQVR